jgi:hypothetical protein
VGPDGVVLEEVDPNEPVYCHCQRVGGCGGIGGGGEGGKGWFMRLLGIAERNFDLSRVAFFYVLPLHSSTHPHPPTRTHTRVCATQVSFGSMVGCENEDCRFEWFHLECVGLSALVGAFGLGGVDV